ncbi:DUF4129 domain-containing transglutaminase family protein [Tengunoibacter tsumagoiensis]|uniref:Transglutaminase n=1 Tax=Tengunoibacter tsumagoiensis TaxID=2014871 RepID=A0A401ZYA2_9CHLR|nr:transglutaminase domain-containing protein [Tengunoibacter tsumagoiensis]GCE11838.1 transglutaminase [Tengunoibacter tsumagoiensis]
MSDTTFERLSHLISETPPDPKKKGRSPRTVELLLNPAEGWLLFFLLAAVLYSTTWSVQAAGWISNLDVLSQTTALGLIASFVAAKQQRFPRLLVFSVVIIVGLLLAFWQTVLLYDQGNFTEFFARFQDWLNTIRSGGTGNDDTMFLFFILSLGFALAVISVWLVYCMRSPLLMVAANAVVLLINLNNMTDAGGIFFLILFLISSLLLLLRFNLYESIARWKRQGLRFDDDLKWDIMQAGALVSVGILIFSWVLPGSYANPVASQIWNVPQNPFLQLQNTWNRAFSPSGGGVATSNHGSFRAQLSLGGNPNLNDEVVLTMQTNSKDSAALYLELVSYETYTTNGWVLGATNPFPLEANAFLPPSSFSTQSVKERITMVNPPAEQNPYILGPSEMTSVSIPASVYNGDHGIVAWVGKNGTIRAGVSYTVNSAISDVNDTTLEGVPFPKNAPNYTPNPNRPDDLIAVNAYEDGLVRDFTQMPSNDDMKRISALAHQIVTDANATSMYDQAQALESYLKKNYSYSVDIHPPRQGDPVAWFLFDNSQKDGFCNYFSSAMVLMARSLGMPARVVAGYAPGEYNESTGQYTVRGKQAHSWVQIDFAGYGWINFEPSASFNSFVRPTGLNTPGANGTSSNQTLPTGVVPPDQRTKHKKDPDQTDPGGSTSSSSQPLFFQGPSISITLGSLILLTLFLCIAFGIWWRRLFRRYSLSTQIYGRICLLASWAGIQLQPSLTPYEYVERIRPSFARTADITALERLGDIYVRERWADPQSPEHPLRSGELAELQSIWRRLRLKLVVSVLRHPSFLGWVPARIQRYWKQYRRRHRVRKWLRKEL